MTTEYVHHELTDQEKLEALRRVTFFSELPDNLLQEIVGKLRRERYAKDDVVFVQGGVGNAMYIIESGQVAIVAQTGNEEKILNFLGPGSFVGEGALLTGQRRSATVRVTIDADLLVLERADLDSLLVKHPTIALTFSRELSRRLSFTDHKPVIIKSYKLIAVSGINVGLLAESLARQTFGQVLVLNLEGVNFPITDSLRANPHITVIDADRNLTSTGLAQSLGTRMDKYDWILMHIPPRASQVTLKALDLADAVIQIGETPASWKQILAARQLWSVSDHPREVDPLARRIARKRVGLALSSGNGRGIAHIGVLKVLEEAKIPVDIMAGTSAGSLFGGLYAAGLSIDELTDFAMSLHKKSRFQLSLFGGLWDIQWPLNRGGLIRGDRTLQYLKEYIGDKRMEDLKIPMHIIAADVITGEEVVFSEGPLADAIRASISVVMVFAPAQVGSRYLIDGGAVNPVPTSVLSERGADVIIASSVIPSLEDRLQRKTLLREGRRPSMITVLTSMTDIMESEIIRGRRNPANIVIQPAVEQYEATDFSKAQEFIRLGEEAAYEMLDQIKQILVPDRRDLVR